MTENIPLHLHASRLEFKPVSAQYFSQNEALLHDATQRWRDSHEQLQQLLAGVPAIRPTIKDLITQRWALDGDEAGLRFTTGHSVSLTEATAFVLQYPQLDVSLDTEATVFGISASHAWAGSTPRQILEHLKTLGVSDALATQWDAYWAARANGTKRSRRDQIDRVYREHFHAAADAALASGTLNSEQMKLVTATLDTPEGIAKLDNERVYLETLSIRLMDHTTRLMPGALVLSYDSDTFTDQLLYLPSRQPTFQAFADRQSLEQYLMAQRLNLWPSTSDQPDRGLLPDYLLHDDGFTTPVSKLLDHYRLGRLEALEPAGGDILDDIDVAPLAGADAFDSQRRESLTAATPALPKLNDSQTERLPATYAFGALTNDVPLAIRQAAIRHQLKRMQDLADQENQHDYEQLATKLETLSKARESASQAATSYLLTSALIAVRTQPQALYDTLKTARLDALRAEACIQFLLKQITDEEKNLIDVVIDTPIATQRDDIDITVYAVGLSLTEESTNSQVIHRQGLDGVLLITREPRLASAQPSWLLYWPGLQGGLQRFASRAAVERDMFAIAADDKTLALTLTKVSGDPFEYGLQEQLANCEKQAQALHQQYPGATASEDRAQHLGQLRQQTLDALCVHEHAARSAAYEQMLEEQQSLGLTRNIPQWMMRLDVTQRLQLKLLLQGFMVAARRSQTYQDLALPAREEFSKPRVATRLRDDFELTGNVEVTIDLPDSVSMVTEIIEGSGAPGVPHRQVLQASEERGKQSLQTLALNNIDDDLKARLGFMHVEVSGSDQAERDKVMAGINVTYLTSLVSDLDLSGNYETHILSAFRGAYREEAFAREYRLECLYEPLRLMLEIHAWAALHSGMITPLGKAIFDVAINADSTQAYSPDGKQITLLPARLETGGTGTPGLSVTLSGVTFIHEQHSGITLLYLPDSPDGVLVRQYSSRELARQDLFNLTLNATFRSYLVGRAIHGDSATLLSRLNQAHLNRFDGFVGIGSAWPATTSLKAHLCDAHMGRLIEANRATSRSNTDLYLETVALKSGMMFNYIKMAIGFVPLIGTVVPLYDAWTSANLATAAFLRGSVQQGIDELQSTVYSLVDVFTSVLTDTAEIAGLRALARQRQLKSLALTRDNPRVGRRLAQQPRTAAQRFEGYEYQEALDLRAIAPGTGIYRGVYRHAKGDFIISHGRNYQVQFDTARHTWRLVGKGYKQPIALDFVGRWDTHGVIYGTNIVSPVAGGGGVIGRLANTADPFLPQAMRNLLPDWWKNHRTNRRKDLRDASTSAFNKLAITHNTLGSLQVAELSPTQLLPTKQSYIDLIENTKQTLNALKATYSPELESIYPGEHIKTKNAAIEIISQRTFNLLDINNRLIARNQKAIRRLNAAMGAEQRDEFLALVRENVQFLNDRELAINNLSPLIAEHSIPRIRNKYNDVCSRALTVNHHTVKSNELLGLVYIPREVSDTSHTIFASRLSATERQFSRALSNHYQLHKLTRPADVSTALDSILNAYQQFRRRLSGWAESHPQYFDRRYIGQLEDSIDALIQLGQRKRKQVSTSAPGHSAPSGSEPRTARVFETEDNQTLVGVESARTSSQPRRFTVTGPGEVAETYIEGRGGKWKLESPPASTPEPAFNQRQLEVEAQEALTTFDNTARRLNQQLPSHWLPADIEDMLVGFADQLEGRAHALEQTPLATTLRHKAQALRDTGQQLRIRQTLASTQPNEGHLAYLIERQEVRIIKEATRVELKRRADGSADFLQEYRIVRVHPAETTLWYAHFHYTSTEAAFKRFTAAHLKLPEYRYLGPKWQQAQAEATSIWRGPISLQIATAHFRQIS